MMERVQYIRSCCKRTVQGAADPAADRALAPRVHLDLDALPVAQESGAKAGEAGNGTLSSLSTYLLLQKAEEQYGWTPDKEGISNEEAGTIARLFAQYDTNSDDK
jgi:hypothetical protein